MISPMTRYSFILLKGEEEGFLEKLQELGMMDITRSAKPVDEHSEELLTKAEAHRNIIPSAKADVAAIQEKIDAATKEREALRVWGEFDTSSIERLKEAGYTIRYYSVPKKVFMEEWAEIVPLEIIDDSGSKVYFVTVQPSDEDNPLPVDPIPAPQGSYILFDKKIEELQAEKAAAEEKLAELEAKSEEFEEARKRDLTDLDRYLARVSAVPAAENTILTLEGFAPKDKEAEITEYLDTTDAFFIKDEATAEENPPISFRNNWFVKMFEPLTDMYGRPAYNGFDPTPFISIFFMLFFALCMGDAGYGLILIILGFLLKKVESFKNTAPLVITLGVATVVVGFFLHTFFSLDIATWKIFEPIKGIFLPDEIGGYAGGMVLSIVVGIVHLCLAMVMKTITETRNKGFLESLGTWGWTLLIVGGVVVGGFALFGVLDAKVTKWVIIALGVISALGIFVFNNIHRNPLFNIGSGLWDTYNTVTGLLGDVLSYLRLYALGLAGAMLGLAFNDMGYQLVSGGNAGIGAWIGFILIVVIGHTLNIAMCALGAFVHPLRLNFLEFFKNSGYEAAGRKYNPLSK